MTENNNTQTEETSSPVKQISPSKSAPAKLKVATKKTAIVSAKKATKEIAKPKPKLKVIRDSFTMPQSDYSKIGLLKQALLKSGLQVKKSELLRAGILELEKLSMTQLKKSISQLEQIKTGRPKKL
jgi:hypothetical protein